MILKHIRQEKYIYSSQYLQESVPSFFISCTRWLWGYILVHSFHFGPLVKVFLIILGSFSTPTPIRKLLEPTLYTLKATCLRYSPQKPHIISAFLFKIYVLFLIVCDSRRIFSFPKSDDITIKYTLQVHIHISDHII